MDGHSIWFPAAPDTFSGKMLEKSKPITQRESMAACILGGVMDTTWGEALVRLRFSPEAATPWLRAADLAMAHGPYLEKIRVAEAARLYCWLGGEAEELVDA